MVYDLIIVGGGINGAALARLAAFQGLKVALFEQGDFGQGASTNTSKLLHGGLRYLETYDFSLVRDATHERAELLKIAPHLVEARRFLFPNTKWGRHSRPGIKAGMTLYDFLAGRLRINSHGWIEPEDLRKREPHFLPEEICGGYEYSDCVMDDARIVMENLIDAQNLGASISNYSSVLGWEKSLNGNPKSPSSLEITVLDRLSGKEVIHQTSHLALTVGPWTDKLLRSQIPSENPQVKLSQGIHLIVQGLQSESCFILPVPHSRRYFFVVPWKGHHLIGTTETEVGEFPPEPALPKEMEVQELIDLMKVYFPDQVLQVICTITGLRPLARAKKSGTITLSREHEFHRIGESVFSAVGGKYTTHRTFADEFFHFIFSKEGEGEVKVDFKNIKARVLPGAWKSENEKEGLIKKLRNFSFMHEALENIWIHRYGLRSLELAEFIAQKPERSKEVEKKKFDAKNPANFVRQDSVILQKENLLLKGEIEFAYEREWTKTPIDFFRRRTDLYFSPSGGREYFLEVDAYFKSQNPGLEKMLGTDGDYLNFLKNNRHVSG